MLIFVVELALSVKRCYITIPYLAEADVKNGGGGGGGGGGRLEELEGGTGTCPTTVNRETSLDSF